MLPVSLLLLAASCLPWARAVTVYGVQGPLQVATGSAGPTLVYTSDTAAGTAVFNPVNFTGPAAFNPIILAPPPVPSPPPPMSFPINLPQNAQNMPGLSIPQKGSFFGFSMEMSVINQFIPFLNLISLLAERAGSVHMRVGGNTQETATVVPSLEGGRVIQKDKADSTNPTETPALLISLEMLYMMSNVSSLVNIQWYLGIPFNDTNHLRLQIAEYAESILGDNILGFQVGNEPDLYPGHGHRPNWWNQTDYFDDFGVVVDAVNNDQLIPIKGSLIAPSLSGNWTPESIWDTGFIPAYTDALGYLSVERYPNDNCAAAFPEAGFGPPIDPQTIFADYLTHNAGKSIVDDYTDTATVAQQAGKPLLMFETNTASCGGFPGISDSFGSALWLIDYGLQMAYANFSGALLHIGGQDVSYNPFNPPQTNQSSFQQWTVGPIFYGMLAIAEALGTSNTSQVVDLFQNSNNEFTPGYGIWENGQLARLALINYITDPTGQSDYTTTITIGGMQWNEVNATPALLKVKYLSAESVSVKENITWAGQTLGNRFEVDGRFSGDEDVQTVSCEQTTNTCFVTVPAPGFALVFLSDGAFEESTPSSTQTFPTTAVTKTMNTATVPSSVLATSNGNAGSQRTKNISSTSKGSSGAMHLAGGVPGLAVLAAMLAATLSVSAVLR
ncbi:glycoside hydrolase family 79 protein [Gelatoporia subvermispora B]|uniref:Glycoside hydrolase family 79 protein n=1 Tax=Ceriporiopsis subvermispora (strain B) TaxID=914234 RepID=M2QSD7_CERS8|nr:glycoside hydrolase family 79 protein [Gelatoporia subvermispora B]